MDDLQVKDRIKQFILKASYITDEQVKNETLIFEQGIMDSMGFMSLINFIEEDFAIKANDNELIEANFESIDAISAFVIRRLIKT